MLKIISWNINGTKARWKQVERLSQELNPDILLLQEIKSTEDNFPIEQAHALGYPHVFINGQKSYHGVALLSRIPVEDVSFHQFSFEEHARHVSGLIRLPESSEHAGLTMRLYNFYCPSGGDKPNVESNSKFRHKMDYYQELTTFFDKERQQHPSILMGDFNIAPYENDVWNHKRLLRSVGHSPQETEAWLKLLHNGDFLDLMRRDVPLDQTLFTWWGYRYPKALELDYGWRLDHCLLSKKLPHHNWKCRSFKETRYWETPSDHIPIILEIT